MLRYLKSLLCLAVVVVLCLPTPALAYTFVAPTPPSNKEKAHMDISFTGSGSLTTDNSSCSTADLALAGNTNLEKIFNFFIGQGLPSIPAAAAVGNISVESGGAGDPQIVERNSKHPELPKSTGDPSGLPVVDGWPNAQTRQPGWGLLQWTPSGKFEGLAKSAGVSSGPYGLAEQLQVIWWHMGKTSPTGYSNMLESFRDETDIDKATQQYMVQMEGPAAGFEHLDVRTARAKEALRQYGGGSPTSGGVTSGTSCASGIEGGGVASVDGMTFPLITSKSQISKGSSLGGTTLKWAPALCNPPAAGTTPGNCHHDYEAADIMVPTGTTVIAAKDGVVISAHSGNQHPNNVTIKTSDGDGINYYTHMGASTLVVHDGQPVKAADVLGKVGTSVDAMGTAPHLHFDMLPKAFNETGRPDCSGAACSGYPFVNVQPLLIKLYQKLPN